MAFSRWIDVSEFRGYRRGGSRNILWPRLFADTTDKALEASGAGAGEFDTAVAVGMSRRNHAAIRLSRWLAPVRKGQSMSGNTETSPGGSEGSVQEISDLHAQHYRKATPVQKYLDGVVAKLSHPALLVILSGAIIAWIGANLAAMWAGASPVDPPPFQWLQGAATIAAVYIAALILTTQRREDELTRHRDQLTLELGILSERKTTKIIELLEEMRRDNPLVANRRDNLAAAMAIPTDPLAVLSAIEEIHREIAKEK